MKTLWIWIKLILILLLGGGWIGYYVVPGMSEFAKIPALKDYSQIPWGPVLSMILVFSVLTALGTSKKWFFPILVYGLIAMLGPMHLGIIRGWSGDETASLSWMFCLILLFIEPGLAAYKRFKKLQEPDLDEAPDLSGTKGLT